ncbi:MAG TPA: TIGR02206 family membrane protein [Bryobacteraceae bacterium]|nr:TIGR02206 family membrane protein [Bryobacteraceae bacterium]
MALFGLLHLTILAATVVSAALLTAMCRRGSLPLKPVCRTLGISLAANELIWWIYRYSKEGIHARNLPLQLCDVAVWLAVLACFTDVTALLEPAYFAGLAGAGMALLTPNLFSPWPTYPAVYFFLAHSGIVISIAVVIFGGRRTFSSGAVWRSFGLLLAYAAIVGAFDRVFGADYMFLLRKPDSASALDLMGPWPWYIFIGAAVALALFWLLWLPVMPDRTDSNASIS